MRHPIPRLVPLNWIQWLTLALTVTIAVTTPILYLRIQHIQTHQNDGLRTVICHVQAVELANPKVSAVQKRQAVRFWDDTLTEIHAQLCPLGRSH